MLLCDVSATLVHFNGAGYTCTNIRGVSWFKRNAIASSASGDETSGTAKVRIPARNVTAMPVCGDYLVKGTVSGVTGVGDLREYDYIRVLSVTDNRRGDRRASHVAVVGR